MHYQRTLVKGCNWSSKSEGGGVCDCASLANFQMRLSILVWVPRSQYLLCFGMSCMCAKALQLYLTLCNPMDCSPPGSSVHRIIQERILEWVPISSSSGGSSWPRDRTHVSCDSCLGLEILYHLATWAKSPAKTSQLVFESFYTTASGLAPLGSPREISS